MDKIREKAAEKAMSYVNIKPRTVHQVRKYLKDKGYETEVIDYVIELLKEYRYLDDLEYSLIYFQYGFDKGRGISRIKRELAEKGVASDIIETAFEELEEVPDQTEAAIRIAEPMVIGADVDEMDHDEKRKLQAKIGRRLMSRGFSSDVVYKVIGRLVK